MAKGSEQLSARWLEGETTFACCGRDIKVGRAGSLLQRVAEVRRHPNPYRTEVFCMDCRVARAVPPHVPSTQGEAA